MASPPSLRDRTELAPLPGGKENTPTLARTLPFSQPSKVICNRTRRSRVYRGSGASAFSSGGKYNGLTPWLNGIRRPMLHEPTIALPTNEELACRVQSGCATSFAELVRRFQTPVLHFLRQWNSASNAEDVLQETLVRAYAQLDRYKPQWRFSTWLFTIARRMSINHGRLLRPQGGQETIHSLASSASGPLELLVEKESRQCLWSAAARVLCEEERTALWLHYVEGMPLREIAAILERSLVSVKTMMFRARKRLLPLIRDLEPEGRGLETVSEVSNV